MTLSKPIRLFCHPLSGHSHRVELLLSLLKLPYELSHVDLLKGEHKQPASGSETDRIWRQMGRDVALMSTSDVATTLPATAATPDRV